MKNSIIQNLVLLMVILLIAGMQNLIAQDKQIMNDLSVIAQRDFKVFLEIIPVGLEEHYGFSNRNEFEKASLGRPISVLLPSEMFYSTSPVDSSNLNYEISPIWEVPVLVDGNIRCLLRMRAMNNNNCTVIGIGGSLTAIEVDKITKKVGSKKVNEISIISFPEVTSQYLIVHDGLITYNNSKCYKIRNRGEIGELMEESLLNVLESSKKSLNERKGLGNVE